MTIEAAHLQTFKLCWGSNFEKKLAKLQVTDHIKYLTTDKQLK